MATSWLAIIGLAFQAAIPIIKWLIARGEAKRKARELADREVDTLLAALEARANNREWVRRARQRLKEKHNGRDQ